MTTTPIRDQSQAKRDIDYARECLENAFFFMERINDCRGDHEHARNLFEVRIRELEQRLQNERAGWNLEREGLLNGIDQLMAFIDANVGFEARDRFFRDYRELFNKKYPDLVHMEATVEGKLKEIENEDV